MNAFAEMMFSSLLGWLHGLTDRLWRFFSGGGAGGFFAWIGDHWLLCTVVLCVVGTLIDLMIWLIRRKPFRTWSQRWHFLQRKLRGHEMGVSETWRFNHGYEDSIEMLKEDIPSEGVETIPAEDAMFERRFADFEEEFYPVDTGNAQNASENQYRRKRRADRYDTRGRGGLFHRVNTLIGVSGDEQMIDGLPALIDKNKAFHDPVYPIRKE
ncbi:MAG: hypothetical protein IJ174_02890 [Clostridia bacterium]|nr:hypothetical protein [Clostridia bacterium]